MRAWVLIAVARRDLTAVRRSRAVLVPAAIVPLVLLLGLPLILYVTFRLVGAEAESEIAPMLASLPDAARAALDALPPAARPMYVLLVHLLAPLHVLSPLVVSTAVAADSFAGERERRTLEPLLHTPTTDGELFLAKVLTPWAIALAVSVAGFALYAAVVDVLLWPYAGRLVLPDATWTALALWVAPAFSALGIGTIVLVSSRVGTVQESFQLGGLVVLPVVALVVGQATGAVYFGAAWVALLGLAAWLAAGFVLAVGARTFRRDAILSRG